MSLRCNESTDIGVKKKLSVYARVIDLESCQPATLYLCNREVDSGTGRGIYNAMVSTEVKAIPKSLDCGQMELKR